VYELQYDSMFDELERAEPYGAFDWRIDGQLYYTEYTGKEVKALLYQRGRVGDVSIISCMNYIILMLVIATCIN
jgi:hypothetical protein